MLGKRDRRNTSLTSGFGQNEEEFLKMLEKIGRPRISQDQSINGFKSANFLESSSIPLFETTKCGFKPEKTIPGLIKATITTAMESIPNVSQANSPNSP